MRKEGGAGGVVGEAGIGDGRGGEAGGGKARDVSPRKGARGKTNFSPLEIAVWSTLATPRRLSRDNHNLASSLQVLK